jgi:hypothetical protein
MQGHPQAGQWWEKHFDTKCAAPLHLKPSFMEPAMYRCDDHVVTGPTLAIRQVDDILVSADYAVCRAYVLDGIENKVTFKISPGPTTLLYATDIEQTAQYIRVYAKSYILSCLLKIGWSEDSKDSSIMVPLPPSTIKEMSRSPGPLDPNALRLIVEQFVFEYRSLTGMLIFAVAVQIGCIDIALAVSFASTTTGRILSIFALPRRSRATFAAPASEDSSIGVLQEKNVPTSPAANSSPFARNLPRTLFSQPLTPFWNPSVTLTHLTADCWFWETLGPSPVS